MALSIGIPQADWASQDVTLAGVTYNITTRYNGRDKRWRLDIAQTGEPILSGVTLMENQSLFSRYRLNDFAHGDIFVIRVKKDGLPVGRDNFGDDLSYKLMYLSNAEILKVQEG